MLKARREDKEDTDGITKSFFEIQPENPYFKKVSGMMNLSQQEDSEMNFQGAVDYFGLKNFDFQTVDVASLRPFVALGAYLLKFRKENYHDDERYEQFKPFFDFLECFTSVIELAREKTEHLVVQLPKNQKQAGDQKWDQGEEIEFVYSLTPTKETQHSETSTQVLASNVQFFVCEAPDESKLANGTFCKADLCEKVKDYLCNYDFAYVKFNQRQLRFLAFLFFKDDSLFFFFSNFDSFVPEVTESDVFSEALPEETVLEFFRNTTSFYAEIQIPGSRSYVAAFSYMFEAPSQIVASRPFNSESKDGDMINFFQVNFDPELKRWEMVAYKNAYAYRKSIDKNDAWFVFYPLTIQDDQWVRGTPIPCFYTVKGKDGPKVIDPLNSILFLLGLPFLDQEKKEGNYKRNLEASLKMTDDLLSGENPLTVPACRLLYQCSSKKKAFKFFEKTISLIFAGRLIVDTKRKTSEEKKAQANRKTIRTKNGHLAKVAAYLSQSPKATGLMLKKGTLQGAFPPDFDNYMDEIGDLEDSDISLQSLSPNNGSPSSPLPPIDRSPVSSPSFSPLSSQQLPNDFLEDPLEGSLDPLEGSFEGIETPNISFLEISDSSVLDEYNGTEIVFFKKRSLGQDELEEKVIHPENEKSGVIYCLQGSGNVEFKSANDSFFATVQPNRLVFFESIESLKFFVSKSDTVQFFYQPLSISNVRLKKLSVEDIDIDQFID